MRTVGVELTSNGGVMTARGLIAAIPTSSVVVQPKGRFCAGAALCSSGLGMTREAAIIARGSMGV